MCKILIKSKLSALNAVANFFMNYMNYFCAFVRLLEVSNNVALSLVFLYFLVLVIRQVHTMTRRCICCN